MQSVVRRQETSLIFSGPMFDIRSGLLVQAQYSSLGDITDSKSLMSYVMSTSSLTADINTSSQLRAAILAELATVVIPQKNIEK